MWDVDLDYADTDAINRLERGDVELSLRYEQYNSLLKTRKLLIDLLNTKDRPKSVRALKGRVGECLKHFPLLTERGKPIFSKDELTDD